MIANDSDAQTVENHRPSEIQPEDLVSFISLPHYELHKLINDSQLFLNKVSKLNNQAKQKIEQNLFKQALLLLNEAQKILQYAAGSGKSIDRDLIISVLHNLSCTYRNLWIMAKSSTYIEGIVFNLDNQILSLQSSISSAQINENSFQKTATYEIKKSLAIYQLKFLAINSQLKQHKIALNACKKTIICLKQILTQNQVYVKKLMKEEYEIVYQNTMKHSLPLDKKQYDALISSKYSLLTAIFNYGEKIDLKIYKNLIKAAHFSYQIFNKEKFLGQDHPYASYFKKYSIGDVMELKPLKFPQKKQNRQAQKMNNRLFQLPFPEQSLIFKFFLLSISYFSSGTEMRLLLSEGKQFFQQTKQNEQRFRQSQIFHLLAIIVITMFVPFETLYLKHLLNSYKLHYNSDFFDYKTVESESITKIIFLISGKNYSKQQIPDFTQNQYHLKQRLFDKVKTEKNIQTVRKIKPLYDKSKNSQKSFKTISFLQNKSTIILKDYPNTGASKSKSTQKMSQNKSKSKMNKKSKQIISTVKKQSIKKNQLDKKKSLNNKNKKNIINPTTTKSRSKSKKKSLSRYEDKIKNGSNTSLNKETCYISKQIGLSSVLEKETVSKIKIDKQRQTVKRSNNIGNYISNNNLNLRKIKSGRNLKDFISVVNEKSQSKYRSNLNNSVSKSKRLKQT